jgi:hypothetical protein
LHRSEVYQKQWMIIDAQTRTISRLLASGEVSELIPDQSSLETSLMGGIGGIARRARASAAASGRS